MLHADMQASLRARSFSELQQVAAGLLQHGSSSLSIHLALLVPTSSQLLMSDGTYRPPLLLLYTHRGGTPLAVKNKAPPIVMLGDVAGKTSSCYYE